MKIDLIYPPFNDPFLIYLTEGLADALKKKGVKVRLLTPHFKNPGEFIDNLLEYKPDYTLSFNGILPNEKGFFLSDALKIPHISYITDFPTYFAPLAKNTRGILLVPDKDSCSFMKGLEAKRVYTLGSAARLKPLNSSVKEYKITARASSLLPKNVFKEIQKKYLEEVQSAIKRASFSLLKNTSLSLPEALAHSFTLAPPSGLDFITLLADLESYVKAIIWHDLLRNTKESIDVFAEEREIDELSSEFKNTHRFHPALSYESYLDIVQRSEFTLMASPVIKEGGSSLFYETIFRKSIPVINKTPFTESWNAVFYDASNPHFNLEKKASDYDRVLRDDMWENRVDALLKLL